MALVKGSVGATGSNPTINLTSIDPQPGDWILLVHGALTTNLERMGEPHTLGSGANGIGLCVHPFRWGGGNASSVLAATVNSGAYRVIVLDGSWRPVGMTVATNGSGIADPAAITFPVSGPHTVITVIGGRGSSTTTISAPTNYTLIDTGSFSSGGFAAAAQRSVDAASENPGAFSPNGSSHATAVLAIAFAPPITVGGRGLVGAAAAEGAEVVVVGEWDDDYYVAATAAVDSEGDWEAEAEWAEKYWAMARYEDGEGLHTALAHHSIEP